MIVYGRKNYSGSKFIKCNYVKIDTDEIIDALLALREAKDDLNVKKQTKQEYVVKVRQFM